MKQLALLKCILQTPNVFSCPEQREVARRNLVQKQKRRDMKIRNNTQLKLPL